MGYHLYGMGPAGLVKKLDKKYEKGGRGIGQEIDICESVNKVHIW